MKVTVNGQLYEITNKDEFLSQCAELLAPELAKQVQNNIVMMSLRIVLVLVVSQYELIIIVAALQVPPLIRLYLVNRTLRACTGFRMGDLFFGLFKNACVSLVTALPAIFAISFFGPTLGYDVVTLVVTLSLSAVIFFAAIYVSKVPLYEELASAAKVVIYRFRAAS